MGRERQVGGVAAAIASLAGVCDGAGRSSGSDARDDALTIVYRVLFLLFAESRECVPRQHAIYARAYAMSRLCLDAIQSSEPGSWEGLAAASRLARLGCRTPDLDVAFDDALQGPQRQNLREAAGDFVIRRVEGLYAYQLACVVDDAHQGITEVVRGCDLLDSTPRQIHLQRLLGLPTPRYRHLPLVLDAQGRKLSKSSRALPVDPDDPLPALRRALDFLGQPVPADAADGPGMLAAALLRFDPTRMPQCSGRFAG